MDNPFAAIETTLNATALAAVSNASLRWSGATIVGVFDSAYAAPLGMGNSEPSFLCQADDVDTLLAGASVTLVRSGVSTAYVVREVQPDGNGLTRLVLETA